MLIAILYMHKIGSAASEYSSSKSSLGRDLCQEFADDLNGWGAECDQQNLVVRFKSPDVLFDTGSDRLKPEFIAILNDFFPRYIEVLSKSQYKNKIEEIRIEGHTSSHWRIGVSDDQAYFMNMQLSQARTLSVLQYLLTSPNIKDKDWVKKYLTANGLSSSKLIYNEDGSENQQGSQRVEFKVRTKADEYIQNIIDDLGQESR